MTKKIRDKKITVINEQGNLISMDRGASGSIVKFNNIIYSMIKKDSIYTNSYWDYLSVLPSVSRNPRILMIGLGGGTIAYQISKLFDDYKLDIVEIDRQMAYVASKFLPKGVKFNLIIDDGAEYIKRTRDKYDLIILDAYIKSDMPDIFRSDEFIRNSKIALKENGILAVNYLLLIRSMIKLPGFKRLLKRYYSNVYKIKVLPMFGLNILIASKKLEKEEILEKVSKKLLESGSTSNVLNRFSEMKRL